MNLYTDKELSEKSLLELLLILEWFEKELKK